MMRFAKSFLFLFALNFLPLLLFSVFFLNFIPLLLFVLLPLNLFLIFFPSLYLKKDLNVIPPSEPYGLHFAVKEQTERQKTAEQLFFLKTKKLEQAFFCWSEGQKLFAVFSEDLLESLSRRELTLLLSYPFQMARSGDLQVLRLFSSFLFLLSGFFKFWQKALSILKRPFFKPKRERPESRIFCLVLRLFSPLIKRIYLRADKNLPINKEDRHTQALLIWKLQSLLQLTPLKDSMFLSPLFLAHPLPSIVAREGKGLHPCIQKRVQALIHTYPP